MSNTTLLQISTMADDSWINGDVRCLVDVQPSRNSKAGKPFWPIKLTDPDDASAPVISTTVFQDPSRFHGKVCVISGKGNKKTSYNGAAQINIGKQGFFKVVGDAAPSHAPAPQQSAPRPSAPAPSQAAPRPAFSADGAKIGGCVARAGEFITASNAELTEDEVVRVAGIFLRATTRLEQGEWAQQAQVRTRPQPGPGGSVQTNEEDEDVPFN